MIHIALVLDVLQDINLIMGKFFFEETKIIKIKKFLIFFLIFMIIEFVSQLHLKYVEQFQIVLIKIQLIVFVLHVLVVSLTISNNFFIISSC